MTLRVEIPGSGSLELDHLLLDQNGTLSDRGELIPGVTERLAGVQEQLATHILSADTFGTLEELAAHLGVEGHRVNTGEDKLNFLVGLGPHRCAVIGNGRNDVPMLRAAALGIVVIGPEGASAAAVAAADIVCQSVLQALDLLLDQRVLVATLRA